MSYILDLPSDRHCLYAPSDLSPLVANTGLGGDDFVDVLGNPIDCTGHAGNIQALEDRGVTVEVDCP